MAALPGGLQTRVGSRERCVVVRTARSEFTQPSEPPVFDQFSLLKCNVSVGGDRLFTSIRTGLFLYCV